MPIHIPDHILFEDPYLLVLHKPHGLMVEPDRNGYPNLLQQVKRYLKPLTIDGQEVYAQHIHRLDRPVSGIILFAKQKKVLKNLSEQFAERKVKKYYQALTVNTPQDNKGILEHWHRKEKKKAIIYDDYIEHAEKVKLSYEVKKTTSGNFLWDIELHTGKYHQIRAQLGALGCPIIGDALYGSSTPYHKDAIALHACKLIFYHPIDEFQIVVEKSTFVA